MCKGRGADLALVRPVCSGRYQIDAEFALWRLDRRIDLALWYPKAFGVELEMIDQPFHGSLHLRSSRRDNVVIVGDDGALSVSRTEFLKTLLHDADRLAHFLHPHEVSVVAVAMLANRDVEIELGIALIGLCFAQVPNSTGATYHHAGEAPGPCVFKLDHPDIDVPLLEDAVFGQQDFEIVAYFEEWVAKIPNVID